MCPDPRPGLIAIGPLAIGLFASTVPLTLQAQAILPFEVRDIRVEGIQRTEPGTVFSYLPIKVGETLTAERASAAIQALYATGFFKDVRLEARDGVLIVQVDERPAIASVEFTGLREFSKDDVRASLKQLGLAEGRILDHALLDRAKQELMRQYFNRGRYAVDIRTTLSPLERNRVAVHFEVNEGEVAKIRGINLVGVNAFSERELLKLFTLRTPGVLTWWTKNDQYSRQKLTADIEKLRSYYQNRGYLEFQVESTQVSITPDKKDIYITINLTEGDKFTLEGFSLAGELPVAEDELRALVTLKPGEPFSRERLNESIRRLGERLGNDGYAFANVNAVPEIDKEKRSVRFTLLIDPGRKVYVRRINITGNSRTKDEVIRREMRQMEGGWYAADKINRSRERLDRLGFFKEVNVETPPVPGSPDQVDVNFNVTEQSTGNIMLGAGFSSTEGLVLSGSVTQNNLFGTGNRLAVQINSGGTNTVYALSYTNPYFTQDGISLGYDLYRRDFDASRLATTDYRTSTLGAGLRLGVPVTEYDTIHLGASLEQIDLTPGTSPTALAFSKAYGNPTQSMRLDAGWSRDSRDSFLYPTKGSLQSVRAEWGTPLGDLKYYKLSYEHQQLWPLSEQVSLSLSGEIGYGGGLSGKPMPFFRNFYAGGIGSVRGFESGTLGPRDGQGNTVGGSKRIVGSAEILFPFPGAANDRSLRLSAFIDVGAAMNSISFDELRYSAGAAVTWYSPVGPIKLSLAKPLRKKAGDEEQMFQFQLGQVF